MAKRLYRSPEAVDPYADLLLVKLGAPKNKTFMRLMEKRGNQARV